MEIDLNAQYAALNHNKLCAVQWEDVRIIIFYYLLDLLDFSHSPLGN